MDTNVVILTGRVVNKPELQYLPSGSPMTEFKVATNSRLRKNADGGRDVEAVFVPVKVFNAQAESCASYLDKGQKVEITGALQIDQWQTKQGDYRTKSYVIGRQVIFGAKPKSNGLSDQPAGAAEETHHDHPEEVTA